MLSMCFLAQREVGREQLCSQTMQWIQRRGLWWLGRAVSAAVILVSCYLLFVFLQEKLKYFPVCLSTKIHQEDDAEEGLGSLPRNISSLSSLLLFNTTENL